MAAAGVDASNTGPSGEVLRLPDDPDSEAASLRARAPGTARARLPAQPCPSSSATLRGARGAWASPTSRSAAQGCTSSRTCAASTDHDGRPLAVTMRAVADEVAAAADLVKGKADGIPAALVRGLDRTWFSPSGAGAGSLVRTGPGDWFALGHVEAVRAALGAAPGSAAAEARRRALGASRRGPRRAGGAGRGADAARRRRRRSADVGVDEDAASAEVALGAEDDYALGRLVTRLEVAAASEGLHASRGRARAGDGDLPALAGLRRVLALSAAALRGGARGGASG